MKKLSYQTLEEQGYNGYLLKNAPERVLRVRRGKFSPCLCRLFSLI